MLIARATTPFGDSYGVVEGETFRSMRGDPFGEVDLASGGSYRLEDVKLLAPVSPPTVLIVLGGSIRPEKPENPSLLGDFLQPPGSTRPGTDPVLFTKSVVSPRGPDDDVLWPKAAFPGPLLLEPELAIVIGKKAREISIEDAMEAVLGFTNFNDVTINDFLPGRGVMKDSGLGDLFQAKCADTFASVGPYVRTDLTEKDIDAGLAIVGRINGQVAITGNTRNLKYGISQMVSFASRYRTLYPGDVISMGTPAKAPVVSRGDVMEVEIEGIGVLRNRLV